MENANEVLIPKIVDPKDYGLDEKQGSEVEKEFLPVITERENLTSIYSDIVSKEITREIEAEAYDLRLKLVKVRTNTDRIHKAAKAFYLAGGKFVDAWKNKNNTIIEQMEEKLKEIETTSARAGVAEESRTLTFGITMGGARWIIGLAGVRPAATWLVQRQAPCTFAPLSPVQLRDGRPADSMALDPAQAFPGALLSSFSFLAP